jgi:hypothetical protein
MARTGLQRLDLHLTEFDRSRAVLQRDHPIAYGLTTSLSRPDSNVTGVSVDAEALEAMRHRALRGCGSRRWQKASPRVRDRRVHRPTKRRRVLCRHRVLGERFQRFPRAVSWTPMERFTTSLFSGPSDGSLGKFKMGWNGGQYPSFHRNGQGSKGFVLMECTRRARTRRGTAGRSSTWIPPRFSSLYLSFCCLAAAAGTAGAAGIKQRNPAAKSPLRPQAARAGAVSFGEGEQPRPSKALALEAGLEEIERQVQDNQRQHNPDGGGHARQARRQHHVLVHRTGRSSARPELNDLTHGRDNIRPQRLKGP